jgi:hypothetical protein
MFSGLTTSPSAVPGAALPVMPKLPVQGPARMAGLPAAQSVLPVAAPQLPLQAPAGTPQLPTGRSNGRVPAAAPVAAPGGDLVGALPAGDLAHSSVGQVAPAQLDEVTGKASGLPQQVGAMRPAAATQPLTGGMTSGSLYVMVIGALLAGAAAVGGVARRLRRQ